MIHYGACTNWGIFLKVFSSTESLYYLRVLFYSAITLLLAFSLAWLVLMKMDFLYGIWHDHGGIKEGIEKYGPQNRFKRGFADTTRAHRLELFSEINTAVHRGGEGLEQIYYTSPVNAEPQTLLRVPEVVHLEDVAHLIDLLKPLPLIALFCWLLWWGASIYWSWPTPSLRGQLAVLIALLLLAALILAAIGPEQVFNTLHIWVFPKEHQWFFYYQESLMSTMMLAPVLFGWIAASLVLVALAFYLLLDTAFKALLSLISKRHAKARFGKN